MITCTHPSDRHLTEIRKALALRRGGEACPIGWTASHSWFTLRIVKEGVAGNLLLRCGDCERVEFENRIRNIELIIEAIDEPGRKTRGGWPSSSCFLVRDRDRLRIECSLLRIEYNVPPVFGLP